VKVENSFMNYKLIKLFFITAFIGFTAGFIWKPRSAEAQGLIIGGSSSSGTITPACLAPKNSSGNVDISIPSGDKIDMANGTCGSAGSGATFSWQIGNPTGPGFVFDGGLSLQNIGAGQIGLSVTNNTGIDFSGAALGVGYGAGSISYNNPQFQAGSTFYDNASSGSDAFKMRAGARVDLNSGTDFLSDISGVAVFNANLKMGNSQTNAVSFSGAAANNAPIISGFGGDTNVGLKLSVQGNQAIGFPSMANGSLPTCTASTYSSTQVPAGYVAFDSTNNTLAVCTGSVWLDLTGSTDVPITFYTAQSTGSGLLHAITMTNPGTFKSASFVTDVTGVGAGNFVLKVCTDGTTCAAGNTAWTCTMACASTADTSTTCSAGSKTSWTAGQTISLSISTACGTTNQIGGLDMGNTEP
jgi:hypothetical protein